MPLKGDLSSLRGLKSRLKTLPTSVAHDVAQRAAPALTNLTVTAFESDRTVYGEPRPAGVHGQTLSLERTGATRRTLKFVANGTIVRCVLGTKWARYLIGKYGVLPNGSLPVGWSERLGALVKDTKVQP